MRKFYKIDPRIHFEKLDDLIDDPVVIRVNEFDERNLTHFESDLDDAHFTGQPVAPVIIDSYGGSSYGVLGFVAAIESSRIPVATILTSKAMSAGAVLFCFGTEGYRFMHPHASMMIHDVQSFTSGGVEDIKTDARHIDDLNKTVYKKMSRHLGHDENYFNRLIKEHSHGDWFLTAKEAKKHNIANHLRIPNFEVEISMKVKFG